MQLKSPAQQTPCCPACLTTDAAVHAPTWLGSVGEQTHPNGNAEQFISELPPPALPPGDAAPPAPPCPGSPRPSLPATTPTPAKPSSGGSSTQPATASAAVPTTAARARLRTAR
jgi:hypothetical protein